MSELAILKEEITGEEQLALYHFPYCPFCVRVSRWLEQTGLDIEQRNIREDRAFADELFEGGGRYTVPCLRIAHPNGAVTWLYESLDIMDYLNRYLVASTAR